MGSTDHTVPTGCFYPGSVSQLKTLFLLSSFPPPLPVSPVLCSPAGIVLLNNCACDRGEPQPNPLCPEFPSLDLRTSWFSPRMAPSVVLEKRDSVKLHLVVPYLFSLSGFHVKLAQFTSQNKIFLPASSASSAWALEIKLCSLCPGHHHSPKRILKSGLSWM